MAIYSSIAVYARDFFVKKKENNIKSSFIRTFFNFSGVFLINYLFPSMTESVALAKSNFSQHILSVPMVSSAYFAFPTDNFSELLQLPILPKFCIFMTMNYSLIMNLYFLNKIVFSLNETKIFKSFQKEHLKNIAYYSFCHFLIFKPAGILLYRFWITGGVVQLDFMNDLQTKQAVGYYLLFAALYWPLSKS